MLVLSRKINESIQIADNITITVVDVHQGKVRLGITAPKNIQVYRSELVQPGGQFRQNTERLQPSR